MCKKKSKGIPIPTLPLNLSSLAACSLFNCSKKLSPSRFFFICEVDDVDVDDVVVVVEGFEFEGIRDCCLDVIFERGGGTGFQRIISTSF